MVLAILVMVVSVVVAVAPIVRGITSVIFIVFGGVYSIGKAIRDGGN